MRHLLPALVLGGAAVLHGGEVFRDGFEAGPLSAEWSVGGTNAGRVGIDTQYGPATGQRHLVLDDSLGDTTYSSAEAVLQIDLANTRNVVLAFNAKSIGNEPHPVPPGDPVTIRTFDGICFSTDHGATWRAVGSLAALATTWAALVIPLDAPVASAGGYSRDFRIRFSGYDNSPAPIDGIAIDDVVVTADEDQRALLELPAEVIEDGGPQTGYVVLAVAPPTDLTLTLDASIPGMLEVPATVVVPAGQTAVAFSFSPVDDALVNLRRTVTLRALAPAVASTPVTLAIVDDETTVLTIELPAFLLEGSPAPGTATLSLDPAASVPVTVALAASPPGEITIPPSVAIPPGESRISFTVRAINDLTIDGNVDVAVTASASSIAPVTVHTTTVDNETRTLALALPASLPEGASGTATVTISGVLASDLVITLAGIDGNVVTPATVTVPAGRTQASFVVTAFDNALRDGTHSVSVSASAATFTTSTQAITVRDNDPASYRFDPFEDFVHISEPVWVIVTTLDIEGNALTDYNGHVDLVVRLPDGTTRPTTPGALEIRKGAEGKGWGDITLPPLDSAPVRIEATDAAGNRGESMFFDISRGVPLAADDLVWDAARRRLYASIRAGGNSSEAGRIVAIDPSTLQIVARSPVLATPGTLALTSAGEFLYAGLSGDGTVARLDPGALDVLSTFAVGTDPNFGVLLAADICTVDGQPNTVVVGQGLRDHGSAHRGVAVYDDGVARPRRALVREGWNLIPGSVLLESSDDPTLCFSHSVGQPPITCSHLRLGSEGLTETMAVDRLLGETTNLEFRAAGDLLISSIGVAADATSLTPAGRFRTAGGGVCPDLSANRIYFVERNPPFDRFTTLSAFNPVSSSLIRRSSLPRAGYAGGSLVRCGVDGLAFRTLADITLLNSAQFVPHDPPADLVTTIETPPDPHEPGATITCTVRVTNRGPNAAHWVSARASRQDGGGFLGASASRGIVGLDHDVVSWSLDELPANATETLAVRLVAAPVFGPVLSACATSGSIDPDTRDGQAIAVPLERLELVPDSAKGWRFPANGMLYDPGRQVLWTTISTEVPPPLGGSVVAFDPVRWSVSNPIWLPGDPSRNVLALSGNGRYLYVGLRDLAGVCRIDLEADPPQSRLIQTGAPVIPGLDAVRDIEVLDGDGTSFLVVVPWDSVAVVFDGTVPRPVRTPTLSVDRIERTPMPGRFLAIGMDLLLYWLDVGPTGVVRSEEGFFPGVSTGFPDIRTAGNQVLTSDGLLLDATTLTPIREFALRARPCLDPAGARAFLVRDNRLHGFDTTTGGSLGELLLPVDETGDWAALCLRWGRDGFAILSLPSWRQTPPILARWREPVDAAADANGNGLPDAWETASFGPPGAAAHADADGDRLPNAFEYLFGTHPLQPSLSPVEIKPDSTGRIRFVFPRRAGLPPGLYRFETSQDLGLWDPVTGIAETVVATRVVDGFGVETVEATLPSSSADTFFRLRWNRP